MTAFGTVGAVIAAVGIASWTEWRSGKRLKAEQGRSDRQLKEERERSRAEIEEERRIAREREQLAEAYQVQVVVGERAAAGQNVSDPSVVELVVVVVNHGSFTITKVEAQFSYDGRSLVSHRSHERLSSLQISTLGCAGRGTVPGGARCLESWPRGIWGSGSRAMRCMCRTSRATTPSSAGLTGGGRGGSTAAERCARYATMRSGCRNTSVLTPPRDLGNHSWGDRPRISR